jgi:hypothetical protein
MMKLLPLSIALILMSCNQPEKADTPVETTVDNKSISGSIKFTLNRDVNHIGKSTVSNVFNEELSQAAIRINKRLKKAGLPNGAMYFKEN